MDREVHIQCIPNAQDFQASARSHSASSLYGKSSRYLCAISYPLQDMGEYQCQAECLLLGDLTRLVWFWKTPGAILEEDGVVVEEKHLEQCSTSTKACCTSSHPEYIWLLSCCWQEMASASHKKNQRFFPANNQPALPPLIPRASMCSLKNISLIIG